MNSGSTDEVTERLLPQRDSAAENESFELPPCILKRHVLTLWAFLGFFNIYCLRVNLSVALVAMVNNTSPANSSENTECLEANQTTSSKSSTGEFQWDEETQGWILGAFFYGYIVTQIPGGYLAARFGGKRLFGFGVLSTSLLTLLTPLAARSGHVWVLILLRVLEGLGEGVTFPSMHAMWGNWAPVWERTKLAGFAYAGSQIGTVVSMPLSGLLCNSDFLGGWPSVFYVFGAAGVVWFVFWMLIIHETPSEHPTITETEKDFIETSVGKKQYFRTPWLKMLTCPALWGIAAAHVSANWLFYMTLTCLPTYMKNILKFDMKSNGFLSALPYLVLWMVQVVSSYVADVIRRNNYLSTEHTRKLMNTAGLLLPGVFIVGAGYTGCDHTLAVVLLTLSVGCGGMTMPGYAINHLDIAPKFAGVLFGITNALATIPGFLAPIVVGILTNNNETSSQWRIIFDMSGGFMLVGSFLFVLLARGTEMSWARLEPRTGSWTQVIPEPDDSIQKTRS